ncbi:RagB/SusD family nutrient uptake outer membrane protein [Pedobacter sp. PLR]|uniref:RagB/SusD family nutrient uptake outer membrane protein n=1 Tax=Pedobacter sp. PLR TaxID=2994465 RepID=UPI0022464E00|nr:RagB/SusD family nutrient uptake outer membrane protein [Pedobacter sp. PLR]MCX2451880.1 RagB/SusD family nutrient uptake outer membrane protein [Pedobacter sp. PLR]
MKKIFFALLLTTGVFTGCKDYLDIKPKGYTIPALFEDYQKLLNDNALNNSSSAYPNYLTDDVQAGIEKDESSSTDYTLFSILKRNLYGFAHGATLESGNVDTFYESAYSRIFTYNTVINNVENVPDGVTDLKKQLKAEAMVGRAFEYLNLVNGYAVHYDAATAATDLGVPLVLVEDINKKYIRNTVAEVYAFILKDLTEAQPNLATKGGDRFRPTKAAVDALLSKVYLYMGNYPEALQNANEALIVNKALMNYGDYTSKLGVTYGRVILESNKALVFPTLDKNIETIWGRQTATSNGHVFAEVYASPDLLNTYAKDLPAGAVDKRLKLFFCQDFAQFGGNVAKFPGRTLWGPYVEFNMAISTGELMLIAAEAEARVGDAAIALKQLDVLRKSRIVGATPLVAATKDEALKMVLDERRREMPFQGITRLVDLKRLNKDLRFAKTVTHTFGTQTVTLAANDLRYVLPIPPKVLAINPSLPVLDR